MQLMDVTRLSPMSSDETAALLFVCGDQYLLRHRSREGATAYKFLSASAVRAAFAEEPIDTDWLAPSVRRCGFGKRGEWVMIAHPAQCYRLSYGEEGQDELKTLEIPLPRIAFFGYEQRYFVWAFKDKLLIGDTVLFAAPFPNVDANGAICFGGNLVPNATTRTIEVAWQVFLTSPFNQHSTGRKSLAFPGDVRSQWQRLAAGRHRRYPLSDLVSTNRTANMMVDWVLRGYS